MNETLKKSINSSRKSKVLIFDVETSGLIPKKMPSDGTLTPIDIYPYILQIAYMIYDMDKKSMVKEYNQYIRVPTNVFISPKITEITGITREMCDTKGVDIVDALAEFYNDYNDNMYIVAHNIDFDKTLIEIEVHRNLSQLKQHGMDALRLFNALYNKIHNIELYCTMKIGKNICNIMIENKNGRVSQYKKYPKLSELHQVLFGFVPEKMHDAHVDTLACLNCYLKMQETTVV